MTKQLSLPGFTVPSWEDIPSITDFMAKERLIKVDTVIQIIDRAIRERYEGSLMAIKTDIMEAAKKSWEVQ